MAGGAPDYYKPYSQLADLLITINANITDLGVIVTALGETLTVDTPAAGNLLDKLDALDGTMDGKLSLAELNGPTCDLLAYTLGVKTSVETGGNLIDKLDNLDGKADGVLDLSVLMDPAKDYNLARTVKNLDGRLGTLITKIGNLVGIHDDTSAMVAYSQENWTGSAGTTYWTLVSDIHQTRNLLKVTSTNAPNIDYSRDGGASTAGTIAGYGTASFFSAPGVWLKSQAGSATWSAHEEWAT